MKFIIKIFVALMLLIQFAYANDVHGYSYKCGDLLNGLDSNNHVIKNQFESYMVGYVTGKNDGKISLRGKNNGTDDLFYALVKFCRDNPLENSWVGAREVYNKLK